MRIRTAVFGVAALGVLSAAAPTFNNFVTGTTVKASADVGLIQTNGGDQKHIKDAKILGMTSNYVLFQAPSQTWGAIPRVASLEGGSEVTPDIARISPEDLKLFHADQSGLNFTDQFVCASYGEDVADISKIEITDFDLNPDIQNPDTIKEVKLDTSLLSGHYADALIHADDSESKPVGVCITTSGYAAPLFANS